MIYKLLKRLFKEHAGAHIWVPFLVVALLSILYTVVPAVVYGKALVWVPITGWPRFALGWLKENWRELVGIYVAFVWIIWRSVRKASDVQWTMIGELSDNLQDADGYFAIGTIPLREWFEPSALLYLATIIKQQLLSSRSVNSDPPQVGPFRHERVLLFFHEADFDALQVSYLDQPFATAFSGIHDRFGVQLGYLRPDDLRQILAGLQPETRKKLGSYRWFAWPRSFWKLPWLSSIAIDTTRLRPFAVIRKSQARIIMEFRKDHQNLAVRTLTDSSEIAACQKFVEAIEKAIYRDVATRVLWEHCTFSKYLNP